MRIAKRNISIADPPYIIAEIGVNHDGCPDRAEELVRAAAAAGADAVKFQFFQAHRLLSGTATLADYQRRSGARDPAAMLQGLELSPEQMAPAVRDAHALGLHALVTVFSVELVELAEQLPWDAYKIASPDLINRPLIERVMATGKPLIVSAGAATIAELAEAVGWIADHPHLFMQCVSAYPAADDDAALAGRLAMMTIDENSLGYSDHTTALDTGAMAVASGARLLEKHLTYDRAAPGPDHAASLDPAQFAEYVRLAHRAWRMLGPAQKRVLPAEREVRALSRQSLTTARPLHAGQTITAADLTIKRPGNGLPPALLHEIIGRRTIIALDSDVPLQAAHLAGEAIEASSRRSAVGGTEHQGEDPLRPEIKEKATLR